MKPTKSIYILLSLFLISNCGDKVREEITERYDNGQKKSLIIYKGEGVDEVIIERITFNESGDILILEKPLEKMRMVRRYYENRQIEEEENYKDGVMEGIWTSYYENGQISYEGNFKDWKKEGEHNSYWENGQILEEYNFKDGEKDGKQTNYNEDGSIEKEDIYKNGKLVK